MSTAFDSFFCFPGIRALRLFLLSLGLLLGTVFASGHPALAQAPANDSVQSILRGRLHNAAGAPIAGARIRLSAEGKSSATLSAEDGGFRLDPLIPGHYKLTIEANGKSSDYTETVNIQPGIPAVSIELSDRGEISVALIKDRAAAATGGQELSSQAVSELPLNKRDFSQLLLLAAGTMTDTNGATNFTAQFAINGQRGVEATFAMDGADISDPEMGGSTFSNFNVDAVEAINSSSGWMPAEIGRGAAGFTNIVTRSGASGFHGSLFEFVRNSAFDARNYFDHPTPAYPGRIPPFRRNEFGLTNGGPIYLPHIYDGRNHTFYFAQYQGFRQVLGTTQVMPVPTATERAGTDVITFPDGSTDTLHVPVDPSIASILARYPMPNDPAGPYGARTYATASKVDTDANQFSIRLDHKFSDKDQFFARFNYNNLTGPTTNPDQTAIDPSFAVEYFDRQRNVVGTWTHAANARLTFESLIGIIRSTPGFPTPNQTDPAIKFGDGLYEAFNSAGGSVMQSYGNLFQGREAVSYSAGSHAWKAGFEARINRDTTYFGMSPNGEYDFGGGKAYAIEAIPSQSGQHDIQPGDPLPDTLSGFLSGSAFVYTVGLPAPFVSGGEHMGPAAINRENYAAWLQDTWKINPRLTLDYGVRWDLYTPISERALRTASFRYRNGEQLWVINPQPGYQTNWHAFQPRIQASWQVTGNLVAHLGGSIMTIPPNIWADNLLTGSTPLAVNPRSVSTSAQPIPYGYRITADQLPAPYTPSGAEIYPTGDPTKVPANTVMDIDRYERELAAVTAGHIISPLTLNGIHENFDNATLYTWTLGLERKFGNLVGDAAYVGTTANHLPFMTPPNAYPGASPGFAPYTKFDAAGNVIGGAGYENEVLASGHSSYHALQSSLSGTVGHGGPGISASYTWSKSIDDSSMVIGGLGSTGAVPSGLPQNPFDYRAEKAVSNFNGTHGFSLSAAQDLHLEKVEFLQPVSRKITYGWETLLISSISSGAPFTVFSGIQQTGYGSNNVDRPDQIATPDLSTARKNRQDYFGHGDNNATDFFSIPIHIPGGTGPNQGRFGTLGRNTFRGPAFYNYDLAVIKDTPFGRRSSGAERMDLQFRSEFFNIFNIVTMGLPANILTGSGFGQISKTAGNSRQIQFSLKLIY